MTSGLEAAMAVYLDWLERRPQESPAELLEQHELVRSNKFVDGTARYEVASEHDDHHVEHVRATVSGGASAPVR